ncbi:MAG: carbohydrate ABC transporter permease [Anaerolineae bacterium]|jgi:ABC-type glycerol-3-phosphate transport system permease component
MTARRFSWSQFGLHVWLLVMVLGALYPMYFMLNMSLKSTIQMEYGIFRITLPFEWNNYTSAFGQVWRYMLNTIAIVFLSGVPMLVFASVTAYVLARHKFPGSEIIFMSFLGLMMIPGILTLIPRFMWVVQLGMSNTWWAVILPYIAGGQSFNMFMLKTFFEGLPEELFEAARLDGANHIGIWRLIILPLSVPILATLAIMHTLGVWNDFIWPLMVLISNDIRTISQAIVFLNTTGQFPTPGRAMAGNVIASIPLLIMFFFGMRSFISGITSGAVKL